MQKIAPTEIRSKEDIENRKIAVLFNCASLTPTVTLHAAMVRDLLRRGNEVTVYVCDGSFQSPTDNPFNRKAIQRFQMFRARDAVKGLDVRFKVIDLRGASEDIPAHVAQTLEIATMSSFASLLKAQSKEELSAEWLRAYRKMLSSAKKLYTYLYDEAQREGYELMFTYNGRFGDARPALEAARNLGIGFGLYELKGDRNEVVFINELIHSIEGNTRRAIAAYESDRVAAEANARTFFEKKIHDEDTGDPVYTKSQEKGSLPEGVEGTTKKVIAIYPTTEDEFKFIGKEWDGKVVESQVDEIDKLAGLLSPDEHLLVVKMHPNQARTAENTIKRYVALTEKYPHVIVEKPLSKKDTYALMRRADIVVTFASTAGVEATYARKPVILIGDTRWGNLDIANKVYSAEEAAILIKRGIEPKPIKGAIIWGNYFFFYRDRLPGLEIGRNGDYTIDGKCVGKSVLRRALQMPARTEIYMKSPGFSFGSFFVLKVLGTAINILKGK